MLTLWSILKAGVLVSNAFCILHRERFLRPMGYAEIDQSQAVTSPKNQAIGLLTAVGYLKVPLIFLNTLVVLVELLFG